METFKRSFILMDFDADKPFAAFLESTETDHSKNKDPDKNKLFITSGEYIKTVDTDKNIVKYTNPIGVCSIYPVKTIKSTAFTNNTSLVCKYDEETRHTKTNSFWSYNSLRWMTYIDHPHIDYLVLEIEFYDKQPKEETL